jgi:hypothetical protein
MIRWLFSLPAALLYGFATTTLCAEGSLAGEIGLFLVAAGYLIASTIALWILKDAKRLQCELPYDFGSWVFFLWPVMVPLYLFKTRGWRGMKVIGLFVLIYAAGTLLGLGLMQWLPR